MEALIFFLVVVIAYLIPSIMALSRHKDNAGAIILINLLVGWTAVGWLIALALAAGEKRGT